MLGVCFEEEFTTKGQYIASLAAGAILAVGFASTPTFAASTGSYTNGTIVQFQGQSPVYLVNNGTLHWISSPALFSDLGYQWSQVKVYPYSVPRPPAGMAVRYLKVKGQSTLYYLSPYGLYPLPDPHEEYRMPSANPPSQDIYTVASLPESVSTWQAGYDFTIVPSIPSGVLIGTPNSSDIYVAENGHLHWIPSAAIFNASGYQWSQVYKGGDPHLTLTNPWNNVLPISPGTPKELLQVKGTSKIYALMNGSLHWIPSWSQFQSFGFQPSGIQPVNYLPYPIGSPLTSITY